MTAVRDAVVRDRACGLLVGTAVGDAYGAPLEFIAEPAMYPRALEMSGGGFHGGAAGAWTDDTAMAIVIAQAAATHGALDDEALDAIASGWEVWSRTAPDVGNQTRHVIGAARRLGVTAANMTQAAREFALGNAHADGNGSLMRTAPVVLQYLDDAEGLADAARRVSAMTHAADDSVEACVLWCTGMRGGVLGGTVAAARSGVFDGLAYIDASHRDRWRALIEEAEANEPWDFPKNGWVIHAFQAAWSAVTCVRSHEGAPSGAFARGVDHAVRCGSDTDTVGAIAGAMMGAIHGVSAMPTDWVSLVHGWPGMHASDLVALADAALS